MPRNIVPYLVFAGFFAALAVFVRVGPAAHRDAAPAESSASSSAASAPAGVDPVTPVPPPPAAPPDPELPELRAGATVDQVSALFPGVFPHVVNASSGNGARAYEWSASDGRYALAEFVDGAMVVGTARRPLNIGLPAVEAPSLPGLHAGATRAEVEGMVGPGRAVARAVFAGGDAPTVTYAWAIRDRGVGTGRTLLVTCRDDRVLSVIDPWSRR